MVSGASGAARSQKAQQWKGPNTIGTRERAWQKRQRRVETCNAGRAGAHRPSEELHPTRSSDLLPRIARSASLPAPAEWLDPITSKVPCQRINSNQKLPHGDSAYKLRANQFNPRKNRGRFADLMPGG